jgi:hypothetical protein
MQLKHGKSSITNIDLFFFFVFFLCKLTVTTQGKALATSTLSLQKD